jgi:epoxyqueuosine reductase QueG
MTREPVQALAKEAGFSEAGVVALPYPEEARDGARFEEWVSAGRAGSMAYLARKKMANWRVLGLELRFRGRGRR